MHGGSGERCNMHLVEVLQEDDVSQSPRIQQTVANFGDHQRLPPFMDFRLLDINFFDINFFGDFSAIVWLFTPIYASSCPIEV
jgi:hypothetical protein